MPKPPKANRRRGELPQIVARTDVPEDSSGFLLWRANLAWQRRMRAVLQPHGITAVQFTLLFAAWWLNELGEETTQRKLAAEADTDEMMTSQVIRRLEADGLVARTPSTRDARARTVQLTKKGRDTFSSALADVQDFNAEYFGRLGAREEGFRRDLVQLVRDDMRTEPPS